MPKRSVFFISDSTGITAEALGLSLLAHFDGIEFEQHRVPFIDSADKAREVATRIARAQEKDGHRPILVMTLVGSDIRAVFRECDALSLDLFGTFIDPLSAELGMPPAQEIGMARRVASNEFRVRLNAINFTLKHDDGVSDEDLEEADLILVGVSRCGKTPTSLYLAMQFGIKCANYPLLPEDFERRQLPGTLAQHRKKLFGLTVTAERLSNVRKERRPDSVYSAINNCRHELTLAEDMMRREGIKFLDNTSRSIEETATAVMQQFGMERH
ncbi:MAG: pyruvate, water dikinase regulatory protein [Methylophilaceae bacterium]